MTEQQDKSVTVLPDGSAFAVMTSPLPTDHWLKANHANVPPMLFRMGTGEQRVIWADKIRAAAQYAIRASTMNGKESNFDPDAMVQNMIVGMLGYWTADGTCGESWADPADIPPLYTAPSSVEALTKEVEHLRRVEFAFNEWLEKSEWVQKDADGLFRGMLGMHRADCMRKVIDQLRTTNAAQAERIAELEQQQAESASNVIGWCQKIEQLEAQLSSDDDAIGEVVIEGMGIGDAQIVRFHMYKEIPPVGTKLYSRPLLQSSTPAEPQAGVELTDEEIVRLFASYWEKTQTHPCNISPDNAVIEFARAINQRQAVKALSAAQPDQA